MLFLELLNSIVPNLPFHVYIGYNYYGLNAWYMQNHVFIFLIRIFMYERINVTCIEQKLVFLDSHSSMVSHGVNGLGGTELSCLT